MSFKKLFVCPIILFTFITSSHSLDRHFLQEINQLRKDKITNKNNNFLDEFSQKMLETIEKLILIESQKTWWDKTKCQVALNGLTGPFTHSLRLTAPFCSYLLSKVFDQHESLVLNQYNAPNLHALIQTMAKKLDLFIPTVIFHGNNHGLTMQANMIQPKEAVLLIDEGIIEILDAQELEVILVRALIEAKKGTTYLHRFFHYARNISFWTLTYKLVTQMVKFGEINKLKGTSKFFILLGSIVGTHLMDTFFSRINEKRIDFMTARLTKNPQGLINALKKLQAKQIEYQPEYEAIQQEIIKKIKPQFPLKAAILNNQVSFISLLKEISRYVSTQSILGRKNTFADRIKRLEKMIASQK